ncbi:MAG: TIGR02921 family PEP-CTERM protein [Candidatus Promineifilaceae bacterium]
MQTEIKPTLLRSVIKRARSLDFWGHFLFWTWNAIFLMFIFFGFLPVAGQEIIDELRNGTIPALFPISLVILTMIPLIITVVGAIWLRKQPRKLLAIGYGVEGPLMLLFLIRIFAFRQIPATVVLLLFLMGIAILTLLWQIFDKRIDARGNGANWLRLVGASAALFVTLYGAIWAAFYAFPLFILILKLIYFFFADFIKNMGDFWTMITFRPVDGWIYLPITILWGLLFGYTATVFAALPVAVSVLFTRLWRRALRVFSAENGPILGYGLTGSVMTLIIIVFLLGNRQYQQQAFDLLETPPVTREAAVTLLKESEIVRDGLLNAYLASSRYVTVEGEMYHIKEMYINTFMWKNPSIYQSDTEAQRRAEWWADPFVNAYSIVAQPILYQPAQKQETDIEDRWRNNSFREESAEAATRYEQFFDRPILRGEREEIVRAARTTWNVEQAANNWRAVDDREVLLTRQEITIKEDGDMADIELYEVYQNQLWSEEEVLYYFSLPESAVITGLWLGDSADKSEAFTHRVSPRGAAQAVYRNEVRRNVDPALLEQLGPRQYRLRAFPVPPKSWSTTTINASGRDRVPKEGATLHLWMTYRVLGSRELPQLAVKRNVYWDDSSVRLLNGEPMRVTDEQWMPPGTPTPLVEQDVDTWRKVEFDTGQTVLARPLVQFRDVAPSLPESLSLAVVLDRSRSMVDHERAVAAALDQLGNLNASVDVILTSGEFHPEEAEVVALADLEAEDVLYFGGQHAGELLAQYDRLKQKPYDAVFVLTDNSGYEQGESPIPVPQPDAPVWMLHFGGFPIGYDDDTLQAIQASGGAATNSLGDALTRLALTLNGERASRDFVENYEWRTLPTEVANEWFPDAVEDKGLAPFAARRLILSAMVEHRGTLGELDVLDQLHAIAVENSIVTPYSSMIVLVNDRQQKLLDELENADDRFEREFEEIDDTQGISVTGVPEPHEYVLMALAVAMLIWYRRQNGAAKRLTYPS